jgi:hypothetical protein
MSAPKAQNGFVARENCFVAARQTKQFDKNQHFQLDVTTNRATLAGRSKVNSRPGDMGVSSRIGAESVVQRASATSVGGAAVFTGEPL